METNNKEVTKKGRINPVFMLFGLGIPFVILVDILTSTQSNLMTNLPFGASTIIYLSYLSNVLIGVGILYLCKSVLFFKITYMDYVREAKKGNVGAALIIVAIEIGTLAMAIVLWAMLSN